MFLLSRISTAIYMLDNLVDWTFSFGPATNKKILGFVESLVGIG